MWDFPPVCTRDKPYSRVFSSKLREVKRKMSKPLEAVNRDKCETVLYWTWENYAWRLPWSWSQSWVFSLFGFHCSHWMEYKEEALAFPVTDYRCPALSGLLDQTYSHQKLISPSRRLQKCEVGSSMMYGEVPLPGFTLVVCSVEQSRENKKVLFFCAFQRAPIPEIIIGFTLWPAYLSRLPSTNTLKVRVSTDESGERVKCKFHIEQFILRNTHFHHHRHVSYLKIC